MRISTDVPWCCASYAGLRAQRTLDDASGVRCGPGGAHLWQVGGASEQALGVR